MEKVLGTLEMTLKDFFFAGVMTIGCSESINSYIKRFLDAKTSLVDFALSILFLESISL